MDQPQPAYSYTPPPAPASAACHGPYKRPSPSSSVAASLDRSTVGTHLLAALRHAVAHRRRTTRSTQRRRRTKCRVGITVDIWTRHRRLRTRTTPATRHNHPTGTMGTTRGTVRTGLNTHRSPSPCPMHDGHEYVAEGQFEPRKSPLKYVLLLGAHAPAPPPRAVPAQAWPPRLLSIAFPYVPVGATNLP
ncbi:hypothetical protein MSAN_01204800 [Mycena sanguinolenta]|uniref:Uncharacterized protein n=1 Tax=Mycena sanguinolenta TaxID=230812 RepID=A0A8H7D1L0_9AGAR|nr:hypothetical protein MSAN_01204800 [Mycena sanguinolenta]